MTEISFRSGTHPDKELVAALVHGNVAPSEAQSIERHMASCDECFSAYAEAVEAEIQQWNAAPVPLEEYWRRAALDVAREGTRTQRERPRPWKPVAVMGAASFAIAILAFWFLRPGIRPTVVSGPLATIVGEASARGLVLPGGEAWADRTIPPYRGPTPGDPEAQMALRSLARLRSADDAVGAVSGSVALGQLRVAQSLLEESKQRFAGDSRVSILEAVLAYEEGDLAAAKTLLEAVVRERPHDPLARLDLAIVMIARGRDLEAQEHLEVVIKDANGSPLAARAERVKRTSTR